MLFDIRKSDVRRSVALAYRDPFCMQMDLKLVIGKEIEISDDVLLFTIDDDGKFYTKELEFADDKCKFCSYIIYNGKITPLYKDIKIRGELIYLDKISSKGEEDGSITIFKRSGLALVQGKKYFGYNLNEIVFNNQTIIADSKNICGFGQVF